jgi:two-component system chemotaxis sensor kinase CheA
MTAPLTLDTVAARLVTLEISDRADLELLRDALVDIAFGNRVPPMAQPFVARAARLLGTIISGAEAPVAVMAGVHAALESAMEASEGSTPRAGAMDAPAPVAPGASHQDRLPDDADHELLPEFITESLEFLAASESALLRLEEDPADDEAVNEVFRAFHTVKGTAAFLGLERLTALAHEAESLLSRVREKEIRYTRGCAELSLRSVDMLKALLAVVEGALAGDGALPVPAGYGALVDAVASYDPALHADGIGAIDVQDPAAGEPPAPDGEDRWDRRRESRAEATVRVRTDRLDRLIDTVGELVIAQSMVASDAGIDAARQQELLRKVVHTGKIVRELQDLSMSMRMVPLRATFARLTRVVRDSAMKCGKVVQFSTDGDDVEIDRNLADLLADPLVHMLRNSVDHGIEPAADRARAGKPATGVVRISAYHASGSVVVELSDDGRGLHRDKIVAKAIEKGLIATDNGMTDADVFTLLFAPGFSTAERVTELSGRGVGMDVVRRNIESVRGRIDIRSTPGAGTTFIVRLPLTMAVTDGMVVRVGAERFIVPLTHIHMSFRPEASMLSTIAGAGEAVLLRGELMPVLRLHRLFDVPDAAQSATEGLLMIVGEDRRRTAILVDELLGQQRVMAKPLGRSLGKVPGISGGAILGDGRVALILDVPETVAMARGLETAPPPGGERHHERHHERHRSAAA